MDRVSTFRLAVRPWHALPCQGLFFDSSAVPCSPIPLPWAKNADRFFTPTIRSRAHFYYWRGCHCSLARPRLCLGEARLRRCEARAVPWQAVSSGVRMRAPRVRSCPSECPAPIPRADRIDGVTKMELCDQITQLTEKSVSSTRNERALGLPTTACVSFGGPTLQNSDFAKQS